MKRSAFILVLLIAAPSLSFAQKTPPAQLQHFAPLIGTWKIDQQQMNQQGQWNPVPGHPEWKFEWAMDGQAVIDHWTTKGLDPVTKDSIPVHGINLRVYDPKTDKWNIRWIESITRKYATYEGSSSPEEFKMEGVNVAGREARIRFYDYEPESFKWELAWTFDQGKSWVVISRMTGHRVKTK